MKHVLIVAGMSTIPEYIENAQELEGYMADTLKGVADCTVTFLDDIAYTMDNGSFIAYDTRNKRDLTEYDAVFIRARGMKSFMSHAFYLSRYCTYNGIPCPNDYSPYYTGTKISQTIIFLEEQAPFIKTLYTVHNQELIRLARDTFAFPYILKAVSASHGDSNYLVKDQAHAERIIADEPEADFMAQAFCPNDRDYRLLLMGSSYLLFERRGKEDSHLNNTSAGGIATLSHDALPDSIVAKARDVANRLGLSISGPDIMPNLETGEFYFLEINSQPQLRTGALLEEKQALLRHFFEETLA
jgi:glutathione synthase/RimK-type ligase-like ATP-grasp enzyme